MSSSIDNNPFLSVIMTSYNTERYIGEAITSILRQSYDDFELIVYDDGSNDSTPNIIMNLSAKNGRVLPIIGKHIGTLSARRKCVELAIGEYVVFMDSDDTMRNDALEKIANIAMEYGDDLIHYGMRTRSEQDPRLHVDRASRICGEQKNARKQATERVVANRERIRCPNR